MRIYPRGLMDIFVCGDIGYVKFCVVEQLVPCNIETHNKGFRNLYKSGLAGSKSGYLNVFKSPDICTSIASSCSQTIASSSIQFTRSIQLYFFWLRDLDRDIIRDLSGLWKKPKRGTRESYMSGTRVSAARPGTRTPDALVTPSTPPAIEQRRSTRPRKPTSSYAQEQEEEQERRVIQPRHKRSLASTTFGGDTVVNTAVGTDQSQTNQTEWQGLLSELKNLREELRRRDTKHEEEVQRIRAEFKEALAEVQRELEEVKGGLRSASSASPCSGHDKIIQELQSLRSAITTPTTASDYPSWAAVVANGSETQPTPWSALPGGRKRQAKETNCVRVSTQRGETDDDSDNTATFRKNLPPDVATAQIQKALANAPATQDTQVLGVGITRTGYLIRFRNEDQADTARCNTEWLGKLGNNTKLVRPRFGVVVHRTPTEALTSLQDDDARINKIMEENEMGLKGFRISQISWLRKDKERAIGKHGSLGIWFDTREAAEWLMERGLLVGHTHIGSVVPYQVKEKRCYRCQGFGHLAWACKEQARCGHCTGNHERRNCPPRIRAKCLDCTQEHPTGDRTCPKPAHPPTMQ
jgi:hypothetical protein